MIRFLKQYRVVVALLVAVAYVGMTTAAATHNVLHQDHAAVAHAAHEMAAHDGHCDTKDSTPPTDDTKRGSCFLCTCNPMNHVFMVTGITVAEVVRITPSFASVPESPSVSRACYVPGLRAPPVGAV